MVAVNPKFIRLIVDDAIELIVKCPRCTAAAGAEVKHTLRDNYVWYEIPRDVVTIEDMMTAIKGDLGISVGFNIYLGQFLLLPSTSVKILELSSKSFITVNLFPCCDETNPDDDSGLEFPYGPLLSSTGSAGETTAQSTNNIDVSNLDAHESSRSAILAISTNAEVPLIMTAENREQSPSSKNTNLNEKSSAETIDKEASPPTRSMENDVEMNPGNSDAHDGDNPDNQYENESQIESGSTVSDKCGTSSWTDTTLTTSCSSVFGNSEINTTTRCTNVTTANNDIGKLAENSSASLSPVLPSSSTLPSAAQSPRSSSKPSSVTPSTCFENEIEIATPAENEASRKRKIPFFPENTDIFYTSTPSVSMTAVTPPPSKIAKANKKSRSSSDLISPRSSSYSDSDSKENDKMPLAGAETTKILVDRRIWFEKLSGDDDSMTSTSGNDFIAFSSPVSRPGTPTPKSGKALKDFMPFQLFMTTKLPRNKSSAEEQEEELSWQPVSALDRENVPHASYVRFQYVVKENYSGPSVQEFPVVMIFDDFVSFEDGEGIQGRVIEEADVFVRDDNMKFFKMDNIQNPAIFK